jgi:hypothetical protein
MENKEILFENSHVRDKATVKEMYSYEFFKKRKQIVLFALLAFFVILYVGVIIWEYVYFGIWSMNYWIIALYLLIPILEVLMYIVSVKTTLKRDIEMFGKELEAKFKVTSDSIICESMTGSVTETGFDKIKSAAQTKNLIVLRSKANLLFVFRKDGFSIGTKEDFVAFLKSKGIRVRGR